MKSVTENEHPFVMNRMFIPELGVSEAIGRNAYLFWQNQDNVLAAMHAFSNGWFERRHTGISAALVATERMCKAETPFDLFREYRQWMSGTFQRGMADVFACHQQLMAIVGTTAQPLPQTVAKMGTQPSRSEPPSAAGSKAA